MGVSIGGRELPSTEPGIAVFVSGVASMGLEILAGRIVAPEFGSSIYTWGTIIGVFLAALSAGYYRGGKLAAAAATPTRLARLLLGTAAYVAVVIFAGDLLVRSTIAFPLPSRLASLPAVVLLFGPPTYLLGFISPYAAELSGTEATGEAAGNVYAIGTVGSIVGAFGTTYLLVPALSVTAIGFVFGLLLVATALALVLPAPSRHSVVSVVGVLLLLVAAVASGAAGVSVEGTVVYETETAYQELRVVDSGDTRTLYLGGQRHSAMDRDDPTRHVFDYTRYFHMPFLFADDPDDIDRVLFVGGGGFSGPKRFLAEYDDVTVDVVEIDPAVVDVAEEYFAVETDHDRLNVHVDDGRRFLRETNRTYDLIVLDAYRKDKVPFQLTTVEFMRLANDRLAAGGILYANLISAPGGPAGRFYRAEYATMARVFPQVYAFPTSSTGAVQNIELVATKDPERVTRTQLRERNRERAIGIDLSDEIRRYRADEDVGDAPILRDDNAPVDALLDPMAGQEYVIEEAARNEDGDGSGDGDDGGGDGGETPTGTPDVATAATVRPGAPGAGGVGAAG